MVHSFSTTSFSPISFATLDYVDVGESKGQSKKRNKWRNYIARLASTFRRLFPQPKPQPKEEPVPFVMPPAQPPKTVTILAKEPETIQEAEQLVTINDKWSMVASSPRPIPIPTVFKPAEAIPIPPAIKQPKIIPLVQKIPHLPGYAVSSGEHLDHSIIAQTKPKPRINSKAASILLQLLTIEAIIDGISDDSE